MNLNRRIKYAVCRFLMKEKVLRKLVTKESIAEHVA